MCHVDQTYKPSNILRGVFLGKKLSAGCNILKLLEF